VHPERPEAEPAHPERPEAEPAQRAPASLGAPDIARLATGSTRRAPRLGRFIAVGVLVGAVIAAVVALLGPSGPVLGRDAVFLLLFLGLGMLGALTGAGVAVVADRRSAGRPSGGA
jgi:hypothetical protein